MAIRDIYPGEELFINYGDLYWSDKDYKKIRKHDFEIFDQEIDNLQAKIGQLSQENQDLKESLEETKGYLDELWWIVDEQKKIIEQLKSKN